MKPFHWGRALAALLLLFVAVAAAYDVPRLNTVHHFQPSDYPGFGNFEVSRLVMASDGNLYGVSAYGGVGENGYIYRVVRSTGQIEHVHDFLFHDGAIPRGPLFQALDGWIYGTTESGGINQADWCYAGKFYNQSGCGTLFRFSTTGTFQKVHDFYSAADGYQSSPNTGVVQGADGNLYGMAVQAFPNGTTSLFRMTPDGTVSVLHLFATDQSEGYLANAGLTRGRDGALYGTTGSAGALPGGGTGCGTVFKAGTDGSFQTLHVFAGPPANGNGDGCYPTSPLLQGRDGGFYGTTQYGGTTLGNCIAGGCGIVFRIAADGTETVLHRFTATAADGEYPQQDGLVQTPDGTLWGTTGGNPYGDGFGFVPLCVVGGSTAFSCGTVWKIPPLGRFTQVAVLGAGDGAYGLFSHATLTLGDDGNLYGTTFAGGGWGYGTVFRVVLNASTPILSVDSFTPPGGPPGTPFVVNGNGFTGATQLTIGDGTNAVPIPFSVLSDTQISATVPSNAQTSAVGVTAPRGLAFSPDYFYLRPQVDTLSPTSGRVGSKVTLNGAHFDGLTSIVFGGGAKAKTWTYVTGNTSIKVTVPAGAKTGPIVVSNPGGSDPSPTFVVR